VGLDVGRHPVGPAEVEEAVAVVGHPQGVEGVEPEGLGGELGQAGGGRPDGPRSEAGAGPIAGGHVEGDNRPD
jgi:hypothetical protein